MKKNFLISIILFLGLLTLTGCTVVNNISNNSTQNNQNDSAIIFYYSNTCPHCKVVEEFLKSNNVAEKLSFQSKEVGEDANNASDLMTKAAKCNIPQEQIGVPFLWDGSKCVIGQDDIIKFFKDKINVQ
jgi:glutaredoxin